MKGLPWGILDGSRRRNGVPAFPCGKPTFPDMRGNEKDAPFPVVRAVALLVPDHLPATYVCAYYPAKLCSDTDETLAIDPAQAEEARRC